MQRKPQKQRTVTKARSEVAEFKKYPPKSQRFIKYLHAKLGESIALAEKGKKPFLPASLAAFDPGPDRGEEYRLREAKERSEKLGELRSLTLDDLMLRPDASNLGKFANSPRRVLAEVADDASRSEYLLQLAEKELRRLIKRDMPWKEYQRLDLLVDEIDMHLQVSSDTVSRLEDVFAPALEFIRRDDDDEDEEEAGS